MSVWFKPSAYRQCQNRRYLIGIFGFFQMFCAVIIYYYGASPVLYGQCFIGWNPYFLSLVRRGPIKGAMIAVYN